MMQQTVKLSSLFDVTYGVNLELNKMEVCDPEDLGTINFVSRTDRNNGVSAKVKIMENIVPNPANTISVAGGGSVLASFVQPEPYYSGRDLYVLYPKREMSEPEMLFYCACIRKNRYKYNYGRQANRTLKDILIPLRPPIWISDLKPIEKISEPINHKVMKLNVDAWKWFKCSDLFIIERGKGPRLQDLSETGTTPFVTSSDQNNGWSGWTDHIPMHPANVISVARNGSVGESFYQPTEFCGTEDVHIFTPKFPMNPYIGLFLTTIIQKEKYRYNYGRKWGIKRMNDTFIKLPAKNGKPDIKFMEDYIKNLAFSRLLEKK